MTTAMRPCAPIFIAGPTAVGKSAVALELAEKIGGEIISVDSMQVYRGMDIGTAKPSLQERKQIPHHLIDVVEISEAFDAAQFVRLARTAQSEITARGRTPIFCGGTGLYFKALLHGLGDAPPADEIIRAALKIIPMPELLAELEQRDPVTFEKIDRQNPRRVIRALEVMRLTGKPFSTQRATWPSTSGTAPAPMIFGLSRDLEILRDRINTRIDVMFRDGLVAETERLLQLGLAKNKTAMQAIGYRQVVEHLRGERPLNETIELIKIRTRQFAKRQMTWFRSQLKLEWISLDDTEKASVAVEKITAATHTSCDEN